MATSYSKAQSAAFTAAPGGYSSLLTDVLVARSTTLTPTVRAGAITSPTFDIGLPTVQIRGLQVSSQQIGKSELSTFAWGDNKFKAAQWTFTREWPLVDITGSGDTAIKEFATRLPIMKGQVRGWATGAFDHLFNGADNLTITYNSIGTIVLVDNGGNETRAHVTGCSYGIPKRVGGPMPVRLSFQISGPTHGDGTFQEMDAAATTVVQSGLMTVTNTGGPALSSITVLNNVIKVDCNADAGGPLQITRTYTQSAA
jgi:hypothetical protein